MGSEVSKGSSGSIQRHSGSYADQVEIFLRAEGRRFQREGSKFIMVFTSEDLEWYTIINCNQITDAICVYSEFDRKAPAHRIAAVAEYITRANWGLSVGNWEIDLNDGETRFKTSLDAEGPKHRQILCDRPWQKSLTSQRR